MKKFRNQDNMGIVEVLSTEGLTFGDLQNKTGLPTNKLNHRIIEMRKSNLIILDNKKYYLTKYCAVLLRALNRLTIELQAEKDLLKKE